jgi:hypothetical protein
MDSGPASFTNAPLMQSRAACSVAVFARNEATRIGPCLHALGESRGIARPHVTVLLNGTCDGSAAAAAAALCEADLAGCLIDIPHGDKSHAMNLFLHRLRPPATLYVLMDGYAEVRPDALARLAERLARRPAAQAAAAMPSTGRSAAALRRSMLECPGLHGSLFALRGSFVERLAAAGLRLPRGLYRGDGLLGSMVMHDLDALGGGWEPARIAMEPAASWVTPPGRPWRWRDLRRHLHRLLRQARGRLEMGALREILYREGFAGLPADARRMVLDWIAADPSRAPRLWRDPLSRLALAHLRQPSAEPPPEALEPRLLFARMPTP